MLRGANPVNALSGELYEPTATSVHHIVAEHYPLGASHHLSWVEYGLMYRSSHYMSFQEDNLVSQSLSDWCRILTN